MPKPATQQGRESRTLGRFPFALKPTLYANVIVTVREVKSSWHALSSTFLASTFLAWVFASGLHEAGYLWVEARGTTRASRMMLFGRRGVLAWIKDRAILAARAPMAALC